MMSTRSLPELGAGGLVIVVGDGLPDRYAGQ
jgi:hypothetical protein